MYSLRIPASPASYEEVVSYSGAEVFILAETEKGQKVPDKSPDGSGLDYQELNTAQSPLSPDNNSELKTVNILQGYTIDEAIDKMGYGPFHFLIFLFSGLIWISDAMVLMILAVLSPAVKCLWSLTSVEEAFITSVVFVGYFFGSIFWGFISDRFGRKKVFILISSLIFVSGVLSALQLSSDDARIPGYPWLLLCRFAIGFGVGGVAQASVYYLEFLPKRTRALCTVSLAFWFATGCVFGAALAAGVMTSDSLGWHWYVGLSAIPIGLGAVVAFFVPESVRVLASKGDKKGAMKVLKKIERLNFRSLPPGELILSSRQIERSAERNELEPEENIKEPSHLNFVAKFKSLFFRGMWKTTPLVWLIWFGIAWLYYGSILLTTVMLQSNPHCESRDSNSSLQEIEAALPYEDNNNSYFSNTAYCGEELDTGDYIKILWASASELPGLIITVVIIEILGRKITALLGFLVMLTGFCLLFICTSDTVLTLFFFIIRASAVGVFQTMYAYTSEVYPTNIRGLGIGIASSVGRVGGIATPYVAQALFYRSDYAAIGTYAGSCLLLIFVILLLPRETKGKPLDK